ncbi:MAG TPA: hypoxanthine phosphoribosyltransferase [Hanamia sp.]|jgi:hypoxanthine phosphoribosyltransferase|nr:hypoxanthine phosphoribosyltransferase [Hanamia sp.]
MPTLKVHDKEFIPYITSEQIEEQVTRVAAEINKDYQGKKPLFIAILNGAFIFAADLFKRINVEAEICFIKLASYKGVKSTGKVITAIGLDAELYNRDVIIIEDIVDTGKTLSQFLPQLEHHHPASLKVASLLHKPSATVHSINIDYLGFTIPDKFVVGYGLDYDGLGRNLKEIYQLI